MSNHRSRSHQINYLFGIIPTRMTKKNTGRTEAGIVGGTILAIGGPILYKTGEHAAEAKWVEVCPEIRDNPAKAKNN